QFTSKQIRPNAEMSPARQHGGGAGYHREMAKKEIKLYPTPHDCEAAFYDAMERADLQQMMSVWSDDGNAICIHPQGPRLAGLSAIRESFAEIFSHGPNPGLKVSELRRHASQTLAIHCVYEMFESRNPQAAVPPVLATNVYLLTPSGWRMLVHHASLSPKGTTAEDQGVGRLLH
ncbi:MAG TPA: nuclear transport factor 2 family protein, partial [Usitatibacteraceae bacterium]|nr:nuclear transport factor 2 family protein [Usitatibacteraceae bacterium]